MTADAATADQQFGADLLRELGGSAGNVVFSPAGVGACLRMALLGARSGTARQLAAVLRLPGPDQAADGLRLLQATQAALAGGPPALSAPATLWLQAGLPVLTGFRDTLARLSVAARQANFRVAAEKARRDINTLIAEQTAGKIGDLLPPGSVDASARMVLANAVYLKARWSRTFPPGATADGPFHTPSGTVAVPMMRLTAPLSYRQGDGCQVVVLPYEGDRLAMAVLLPDDGGLARLEERLSTAGLGRLLAHVAPTRLRLALPRLRLRSRLELGPVLTRAGAGDAFGPGADFTGISTAERLVIGPVAHEAVIDVDEQGTEAAAATAATMVALSAVAPPPREVRVDRPFLFAIIDTASGLPLFLGRVADPTAGT